jgi:hypothetical protein
MKINIESMGKKDKPTESYRMVFLSDQDKEKSRTLAYPIERKLFAPSWPMNYNGERELHGSYIAGIDPYDQDSDSNSVMITQVMNTSEIMERFYSHLDENEKQEIEQHLANLGG